MAKSITSSTTKRVSIPKRTSQGRVKPKTSSMNKHKKKSYKKYKGQGK